MSNTNTCPIEMSGHTYRDLYKEGHWTMGFNSWPMQHPHAWLALPPFQFVCRLGRSIVNIGSHGVRLQNAKLINIPAK